MTPTVDSNVRLGLFGHIDYIVGDNYAHARATQGNESFKDTGRVFTLRMDAASRPDRLTTSVSAPWKCG